MIHQRNITGTANVTIYSDRHHGRKQWCAGRIPQRWQKGPHSPFNRLVINFSKHIVPLEGECWEVERQSSATGILFARTKRRMVPVAEAPNVITGGVHLNVTDHVQNDGPRWRRHGRLIAANPLYLSGDDFLQIHFDQLIYDLIGQDCEEVNKPTADMLSLCNFELVDNTWHAQLGDRLVLVYQT